MDFSAKPIVGARDVLGNKHYLPFGDAIGGAIGRHCGSITVTDDHRVQVAARCLVLTNEAGQHLLINAGPGDVSRLTKSPRARTYAAEGGPKLIESLTAKGISPEDVTAVMVTDLHIASAGGLITYGTSGYSLTFPHAQHFVGEQHWAHVTKGGMTVWEHHMFTFSVPNHQPYLPELLEQSGRLTLIPGTQQDQNSIHHDQLGNGIVFHFLDGHTPAQLLPDITLAGGARLIYGSDVLSMAFHLQKAHLTTTSDCAPPKLTDEKRRLLEHAVQVGAVVCLGHDPVIAGAKIEYAVDESCGPTFKIKQSFREISLGA